MKKLTLIIIVLMISAQLRASKSTCVCNCNWSASSTWSGNRIPSCSDTIFICSNHVCTINTQLDYSACPAPMYIYVAGQLYFQTGNKLTLPSRSVVTINSGGSLNPGNGGGSSNLITIGTTDVWSADDGTINGFKVLTDNAPLPIQLLSFNAIPRQSVVELDWFTATETNNDYFTIEKTKNGLNYEIAGTIRGAGISSWGLSYKYTDNQPFDGVSYYRLKQTDFDGKSSLSALVPVNRDNVNGFSFELLQNPNDGSVLTIEMYSQVDKQAKLEIRDANGKRIFTNNILVEESGKEIRDFHLSDKLSPGIYMVNITSEEGMYSKKLVVQ
jgi:hypothetical protein